MFELMKTTIGCSIDRRLPARQSRDITLGHSAALAGPIGGETTGLRTDRPRRHSMICALSVAVALGMSGLGVSALGPDVDQVRAQGVDHVRAVGDRNTIGECLLPAAPTKFGLGATYPSPGKVIRVSAKQCEIRGGTYRIVQREADKTRAN